MGLSLADLGAWFTNVATSVMIIFINKLLMGSKGYGFNFAVTLSGLHYLAAALLMQGYSWTGLMTAKGVMPWRERIFYTLVSSVSIIALNVSLLVNTVGFYQIAKLCVIPFVAIVEYVAYSRRFSPQVIACISIVIGGVAIVTVSDIAVNFLGLNIAVLSIVAAGSQQLLCRHQQTTLGISSNEMLLYTAWPMAGLLLTIGPCLDWFITGGKWVFDFPFVYSVNMVIIATCTLAVGVNLSQFMCLGRFTAVAYQVLGHTKTICVLLGGALLFNELITVRVGIGMSLAVVGMVGYGYFTNKEKAAPDATAKVEEKETMLMSSGSSAASSGTGEGVPRAYSLISMHKLLCGACRGACGRSGERHVSREVFQVFSATVMVTGMSTNAAVW
jgi:solute carrier family 35, member E3